MPFPLSMQVAEKKIQGMSNMSTLFSPIQNKKHKKSIDSSVKSKKNEKVYESPIGKKLYSSSKGRGYGKDNKFEPIRGSVSSIKPSKGDTDTESLIKNSRTVFKEYKEWAKIPVNLQKQKRDHIKRGSSNTNENEVNISDNAIIEKDISKSKPKVSPNGIIK